MAELFERLCNENKNWEFRCYSERGIMSYFMFVELPKRKPMLDFLEGLENAEEENPFEGLRKQSPKEMTIFSELDFGTVGFGKPDGAIHFTYDGKPTMLLIEVKLNETYEKSNRTRSYNSTLKGQLELRWRLTQVIKRPKEGTRYDDANNNTFIRENCAIRDFYKEGGDPFYKHKSRLHKEEQNASWRRLKLDDKPPENGVKTLVDKYMNEQTDVYFCAITKDDENPFIGKKKCMPLCYPNGWDKHKKFFCWAPASTLTKQTDA